MKINLLYALGRKILFLTFSENFSILYIEKRKGKRYESKEIT